MKPDHPRRHLLATQRVDEFYISIQFQINESSSDLSLLLTAFLSRTEKKGGGDSTAAREASLYEKLYWLFWFEEGSQTSRQNGNLLAFDDFAKIMHIRFKLW